MEKLVVCKIVYVGWYMLDVANTLYITQLPPLYSVLYVYWMDYII